MPCRAQGIDRVEQTVRNGKDGEPQDPLCMQCCAAALRGAERYLGAIQDVGVPFPLGRGQQRGRITSTSCSGGKGAGNVARDLCSWSLHALLGITPQTTQVCIHQPLLILW